jgi:polyferredoxin
LSKAFSRNRHDNELNKNIREMKSLINLGLLFFLGFSFFVMYAYSVALYEKIKRPSFKNLSNETFMIFGLVVLTFMIVDYFIIKRFLKGTDNAHTKIR